MLVLASFAFIWLLDPPSLAVVIGLSSFSYAAGLIIYRYPKRLSAYIAALSGILLLLIFFKYLGMLGGISRSMYLFLESLPGFSLHRLFLPLGISFIVFKEISYLTDIRWGLTKPGDFSSHLLYSSLFTIFVAGPIERFERFNPQISGAAIPFDSGNLSEGSRRIVIGLFKKMVVADWLAFFLTPVWKDPGSYSSLAALAAFFAYAYQIYYDFAGYSDIAIGASRLFGIRIMENFDKPYLAGNISQFWRRWHISLSDWIRDYLFFPLSRLSKKKFWNLFLVPLIAMGICGLWHGADSRYIVWGIWHGLGLSALQIFNLYKRKAQKTHKQRIKEMMSVAGTPMTVLFVFIGWLSFRPFGSLLALRLLMDPVTIAAMLSVFILLIFVQTPIHRAIAALESISWRFRHTILLLILVAASYCAVQTEFIYAGF